MKQILTFLAFFCAAVHSLKGADKIHGEILEFGTYKVIESKSDLPVRSRSGKQQPSVHIAKTVKFLVHTNRIRAVKGTSFGFRYKLTNMPTNGLVPLEFETVHPEFTLPDGRKDTGRVLEVQVEPKDGGWVSHNGYRFDDDFELAPGEWKFTIYHEKRKILSKTFHVIQE